MNDLCGFTRGVRLESDTFAGFVIWGYNPNGCIRADRSHLFLSEPILQLEEQRTSILSKISNLGDFRKGSITAISGRCGKKNCRCHQPNQPGHGPTFRLTCKINDKTISESFSSPAALSKAQREVNEFHRFQQLSEELLDVNEKICRARAIEGTHAPEEKKRRKSSIKKQREK